jgi:hypothetical protein
MYVDYDPAVVALARELVQALDVAAAAYDLRRPEQIIGSPEAARLIDWSEPVAVLMTAVLHFGQFSDRRVPLDASELVFCVTDMSVTLTGRPGGSADERFGQAVLLPCQRQDRECAPGRGAVALPCGWSAIAIASDRAGDSYLRVRRSRTHSG